MTSTTDNFQFVTVILLFIAKCFNVTTFNIYLDTILCR